MSDQTGGDSSEPGFINYKEEDYDYDSKAITVIDSTVSDYNNHGDY